ncbi:MAG: hypothetical protein C0485_15860 [Pirellula sp.]|nr:hypothetical protein [Pirellula sp.]
MEVADGKCVQKTGEAHSASLIEGRDYYFERGRFVLTEGYLRRRGACCGNGCRHCPYRAVPAA